MKHFKRLSISEIDDIFYIAPSEFSKDSAKELLSNALGATMYTPATKEDIADKLINSVYEGLTSNVLCLEDAIGDDEVEFAIKNLYKQMDILNTAINTDKVNASNLPILFIRVRSTDQLRSLLVNFSKLKPICGFNIPKFTSDNGREYLRLIKKCNEKNNTRFYAMPILETPEIIYQESRISELTRIKAIVDEYKDIILNIRVGGTDFSSLFGMRRSIDSSMYDIHVISNCLSDIMNFFGRANENYTISGPVWEYFPAKERMLKPQLRETPFKVRGNYGAFQRKELISKEIDGLIKEVILDKANGFMGKTIIHPSHILYVNALQIITYEEYNDALSIMKNQDKGAIKSITSNKMNEVKPHTNWAIKVLNRAKVYGVLNENVSHIAMF